MSLSAARSDAPPARTPRPWEYNAATNQHWHPEHGHWHAGPPPADKALLSAPLSIAASQVDLADQKEAAAERPGAFPQPWEYDAEKDQHWDPGHGHWHPGKPPAEAARGGTTAAPQRAP
jgi:hypothetical protein